MPKLEEDVNEAGGPAVEGGKTEQSGGAAAATPAAAAAPAATVKKKSRKPLFFGLAAAAVVVTFVAVMLALTSGQEAQAAGGRRGGARRSQAAAGQGADQLNMDALNEIQQELKGAQGGAGVTGRQFDEKYLNDPRGEEGGAGGGGQGEGAGGEGDREKETAAARGEGEKEGGLAAQARAQRQGEAGGEGGRGEGAEAEPAGGAPGGVAATISVRYAPLPVRASTVERPQADAQSQRRGGERVQVAAAEAIPPFGTRLPVVVAGSFFAPSSSDGIVMLSLSADVSGDGWSLPRGVLLVGRVKNVVARRRIEVGVFGYVNPENNKLVRVSGDALGDDGGTGLKGALRNRESVLQKFGQGARQVAGGLASGLLYRSSVPIYLPGGLVDGSYGAGGTQNQVFVEVEAGTAGYVLVKTLPGAVESRDASPTSGGVDGLSAGEADLLQQLRSAREAEGRLNEALKKNR